MVYCFRCCIMSTSVTHLMASTEMSDIFRIVELRNAKILRHRWLQFTHRREGRPNFGNIRRARVRHSSLSTPKIDAVRKPFSGSQSLLPHNLSEQPLHRGEGEHRQIVFGGGQFYEYLNIWWIVRVSFVLVACHRFNKNNCHECKSLRHWGRFIILTSCPKTEQTHSSIQY